MAETEFQRLFREARERHDSMFTYRGKYYSTRDKIGKKEESNDQWFQNAGIGEQEQKRFNDFQNGSADYYSGKKHTYGGWDENLITNEGIQAAIAAQQAAPDIVTNNVDGQTESPTANPQALPEFTKKQMMDLNFKDFNSLQSIAMDSRNKDNPFIVNMKGLFGDDPSKWDKNYVEGNLGVSGTYRGKLLGDYGDMFRSVNRLAQYKNSPNMQTPDTQYTSIGDQDVVGGTNKGTTSPITTNTPASQSATSSSKKPKSVFGKVLDLLSAIPLNQQGGKMNQKQIQQMFVQYLAKKSGAKTQEELQQYIQQLGKEGLQKEYAQFMQLLQNQSAQKAKHGAKLNMIARLNGITCPEGEELIYFQKGGKFCKKCIQRQQEMKAKFPQEAKTGTKFIKEFKYQIEASKCGSKMHK